MKTVCILWFLLHSYTFMLLYSQILLWRDGVDHMKYMSHIGLFLSTSQCGYNRHVELSYVGTDMLQTRIGFFSWKSIVFFSVFKSVCCNVWFNTVGLKEDGCGRAYWVLVSMYKSAVMCRDCCSSNWYIAVTYWDLLLLALTCGSFSPKAERCIAEPSRCKEK
jgi:hypothetical protein